MSADDTTTAAPAKLRWSHEAKGLVLRDEHGIVFVPYEQVRGGWWNAVTLYDPNGVYPPSGYNIVVSIQTVETAEAVKVEGVPQ